MAIGTRPVLALVRRSGAPPFRGAAFGGVTRGKTYEALVSLVAYARDTGMHVAVVGADLKMESCAMSHDRVIVSTAQWAVTDYGLECREWNYNWEKERLDQRHWEQPHLYFLPTHVAAKTWVDVEDLLLAFRLALAAHDLRYVAAAVRATEKAVRNDVERRQGLRQDMQIQILRRSDLDALATSTPSIP